MTQVSCLKPSTKCSNKSFYGKALILEDDSHIKLQSYNTIVAEFDKDYQSLKINGWYSATTSKHIKSFLEYLGLNSDNIAKSFRFKNFKQFLESKPEFHIS